MYAVIKTGGKQYKVTPGDILKIDKINGEPGDDVRFQEVLMLCDADNSTKIGFPFIAEARVEGTIRKQTKGDKIIVFKSKRRKGYRKKQGHRQLLTEVKINTIVS